MDPFKIPENNTLNINSFFLSHFKKQSTMKQVRVRRPQQQVRMYFISFTLPHSYLFLHVMFLFELLTGFRAGIGTNLFQV
jgi:hypothetical protein